MMDSYLPQFRALVQRADVAQIMCAYSSVNRRCVEVVQIMCAYSSWPLPDVARVRADTVLPPAPMRTPLPIPQPPQRCSNYAPDCANTYLLQTQLRDHFGFKGMVISDNGALEFEVETHHYFPDYLTAAAASLNAGTDNDLGGDAVYVNNLATALQRGLVTNATLNRAVSRNLRLRFQLGEFDPAYLVPYASWGAEHLDTAEHMEINVQAARESLVLLANDGALPLTPRPGAVLAVIGPSANTSSVLLGNYEGVPSRVVTVLQGLQAAAAAAGGAWTVRYASGCGASGLECSNSTDIAAAVQVAAGADAVVFVGGIDVSFAREGEDWASNGACDGVPVEVNGLPGCQQRLLRALRAAAATPLVVVAMSGTAMWLPWEEGTANATLLSLYPGSLGGVAIAEALLGDFNPGGRLPFTVPVNFTGLPSLADVAMSGSPGRTYRYTSYPIAHPFGYGLSYTTWAYSDLTVSTLTVHTDQGLDLTVALTNTGSVDGDEVVQVYAQPPPGAGSGAAGGPFPVPRYSLRAFARRRVPANGTTTVSMAIEAATWQLVDNAGEAPPALGRWTLYVGGQQPGQVGAGHSCGQEPLSVSIDVIA